MSTATATSKFGVALRDEGAREWVVRAYAERPWLTRLHTHTGSQGVALALMAQGVRAAYELAEEINAAAGRRQVDTLDIGGGLPVNFGSDEETPTYAAYARLLNDEVPGLFDGRYGLVTEFGRSLLAKHGTVLARVEYAKSVGRAAHRGHPRRACRSPPGRCTRPASWPLRIAAYDAKGRPKTGPAVAQDVAGPACFAGDLLAENRPLPLLEQGDYAARPRHRGVLLRPPLLLQLPCPARHLRLHGGRRRRGALRDRRAPQPVADLVAEAGGGHADALLADGA